MYAGCADGCLDYDPAKSPTLIDFFSGCGGTSVGFRAAGMTIAAGIDNDLTSGLTFAKNFPEATFISADIKRLKLEDIQGLITQLGDAPLVFSACAPCQPFSKQRRGPRDSDIRTPLLLQLSRFVRRFRPVCIFIENVPGMQRGLDGQAPFQKFQRSIKRIGYHTTAGIVSSAAYGVPQRRLRFVAVASRIGPVSFPTATHGPGKGANYSTVREWIAHLPPLAAGEEDPLVPNHRAAKLSALNLQRIQATPEGGGRADWPSHLLPECHSNGYAGHTDVYGRMSWDAPATGLTTRCISYSNGRFGHPTQDRAISAREAASLQTFPEDFVFLGNWEDIGRQVGNAVPVRLATAFGTSIVRHINESGRASA